MHLQNDIVGADGAFAPFFRAEIDRTGVLTTIGRVLEGARAAGAKVVYTRVAWQPGYPDLHANSPLLGVVAQTKCLEDGTHGAAIADELTPQQGDVVITHQRAGGFQASELDATLRDAGSTPSSSSASPPTSRSRAPPASPPTWATAPSSSPTPARPRRPPPTPRRWSPWACSPRSSRPTSCSPASRAPLQRHVAAVTP